MLPTTVVLLDHFARHGLIIRKNQLRDVHKILLNLSKLRLNLIPLDQWQRLLNLIKITNLLMSVYLISSREVIINETKAQYSNVTYNSKICQLHTLNNMRVAVRVYEEDLFQFRQLLVTTHAIELGNFVLEQSFERGEHRKGDCSNVVSSEEVKKEGKRKGELEIRSKQLIHATRGHRLRRLRGI